MFLYVLMFDYIPLIFKYASLLYFNPVMVYQTYKRRLGRAIAIVLTTLALCVSTAAPVSAAATYNCGAYGVGTYGTECSTDSLANTGQPLLWFLIPVLLILAGILWMWRTRRKKKKSKPSYRIQR
jgi:membrane-associated PAP2 superfamily phosphatase